MEILLIAIAILLLSIILIIFLLKTSGLRIDSNRLDERLDALNRQLGEVTIQASTHHDTITAVNQALGGLTKTSERILELGKDMSKLQEIMMAPTLRGGVGEMMLEELLRQTLPKGFYETQHTFRNGTRVDAVVKLTDGLVPIDAKFPMENFRSVISEDDKRSTKARFRRNVESHVDSIANNYICPGETLDFALMYIPAENVYYEIVLKDDTNPDILDYAWDKRVIPTSPNSLYAYLQIIAFGLRGLQVEDDAQQVIDSLKRLEHKLHRFVSDYDTLGKHLRNAYSKYDEGLTKLDSVQQSFPGQINLGENESITHRSVNRDEL